MKLRRLMTRLAAAAALSLCSLANAAGLLTPTASNLPELEIREHHTTVVIEEGYVTTTVEQVFHNPNGSDLEAIYSFPVPDGAAVGEFVYWINDQPVIAEVMKKQQARQLYEQEKAAGRHSALVEKDQYRSFDISVYPVKSQSDVKIKLVYLQAAHVDSGVGRYTYPLEDGGVDEQQLAFWTRNESVSEKFSFDLIFRSSYPIDALRLPGHPNAAITQVAEGEWRVALVNEANMETADAHASAITLNKDIVVYWRHKSGLPGSLDLVAYKSETQPEGTFMLTVTPGDDLTPVTRGSDWIFVLDISGSMEGKYATLVEGVRQGLGKLRAQDRFKVILFNERAVDLSGGYQTVDSANTEAILQRLQSYSVGGGTNLYAGLKRGLNAIDADRPAGVILVTDGVANVGTTEKKAFLDLLAQRDVRLFTFIMGNSANRPLLQEMTDLSQGFAMAVSNADDIVGHIMLATNKLTHHAFTDVELTIAGVNVKNMTPEIIGSLYRGEQLSVFGHYWQPGVADVTLTAKVGGQTKRYQTQVDFPQKSVRNPEIERLWAFAAIENMQAKIDYLGEDADIQQAITDIALEYGLVTDYTSMLVVEESVFEAMNIDRETKRRVELEQQARTMRANQPVQDNRSDRQQPMFTAPRPSSGGGSIGPLSVMFIALLLCLHSRSRQVAIS